MDASEFIQRAMKNLKLELRTDLNEVICGSFEVKITCKDYYLQFLKFKQLKYSLHWLPEMTFFQLNRIQYNKQRCQIVKLENLVGSPSVFRLNSEVYEQVSIVTQFGHDCQ